VDVLPTLGPLESIAVLGLSVAIREAYSTGILYVWYHSTDIRFILLHVQFEDGLSSSVLKKGGNSTQKFTTGNRKKFQIVIKGPPAQFISHPAFFTPSYVAIHQDFAHQRMSETYLKE
jgi:hypothetical protein